MKNKQNNKHTHKYTHTHTHTHTQLLRHIHQTEEENPFGGDKERLAWERWGQAEYGDHRLPMACDMAQNCRCMLLPKDEVGTNQM
jgi:hypothetical protein